MIINRHGLLPHLFADDTQVNGRCSLSGMDDLAARVSHTDIYIYIYIYIYKSELDDVKQTQTECRQDRINMVCYSEPSSSTSGHSDQSRLCDHLAIVFGSCRLLHWHTDLPMRTHVEKMTASYVAVVASLHQIQSVQWSLPPSVIKTLIVSLVLSILDHCITTLTSSASSAVGAQRCSHWLNDLIIAIATRHCRWPFISGRNVERIPDESLHCSLIFLSGVNLTRCYAIKSQSHTISNVNIIISTVTLLSPWHLCHYCHY